MFCTVRRDSHSDDFLRAIFEQFGTNWFKFNRIVSFYTFFSWNWTMHRRFTCIFVNFLNGNIFLSKKKLLAFKVWKFVSFWHQKPLKLDMAQMAHLKLKENMLLWSNKIRRSINLNKTEFIWKTILESTKRFIFLV